MNFDKYSRPETQADLEARRKLITLEALRAPLLSPSELSTSTRVNVTAFRLMSEIWLEAMARSQLEKNAGDDLPTVPSDAVVGRLDDPFNRAFAIEASGEQLFLSLLDGRGWSWKRVAREDFQWQLDALLLPVTDHTAVTCGHMTVRRDAGTVRFEVDGDYFGNASTDRFRSMLHHLTQEHDRQRS